MEVSTGRVELLKGQNQHQCKCRHGDAGSYLHNTAFYTDKSNQQSVWGSLTDVTDEHSLKELNSSCRCFFKDEVQCYFLIRYLYQEKHPFKLSLNTATTFLSQQQVDDNISPTLTCPACWCYCYLPEISAWRWDIKASVHWPSSEALNEGTAEHIYLILGLSVSQQVATESCLCIIQSERRYTTTIKCLPLRCCLGHKTNLRWEGV